MLREVITNDWYTIFIVIGLVFIVASKTLFGLRFMDFLLVVGNSKYLKIYAREQKFIDTFDSLLFVNLVLSFSVFSYISYSQLIAPIDFDLFTFLKVAFAIAAIILMKVLIERLIGSLFDIDPIIDSYLFQKTTFKNYTGLLLLPLNALLLFTLTPSKFVIYAIFGVIVLINLIGFVTSFKTHQKLLINNLFYFILYLCALEIGPYVILYKVFVEYNA
ncbi:DUF4271 domain-containing protein [Winogradskyella sp. 3972H.M.0a.05]|uniref:DUF4271 domain-containing protein n=1 Tax=Winogradskyella sp. 3972H.M.0a.05 TaxID=2950277 RepID=UPI003390CB28